jgi:hypothetical protein
MASTFLRAVAKATQPRRRSQGDAAKACGQLTSREGRTMRAGDERGLLRTRCRRVEERGRRLDRR